jgi:uncharacterized protein YegL
MSLSFSPILAIHRKSSGLLCGVNRAHLHGIQTLALPDYSTLRGTKHMSDTISQAPAFGFGIQTTDLPENSDPRCPTLLLLDVSGSMGGKPISELQAGVVKYIDELAADPLAKRRVEVAVVTFGGTVQVAHDFSVSDRFATPTLSASGDTPMGQAIVTGLNLLKERKAELSRLGIPQYRAWVFLITDGGPTDERQPVWSEAVQRIKEGEERKSFLFFAVGVQGANFETLKSISAARPPVVLDGLRFRDLFEWLSASQKMVSSSQPGESVTPPPVNWGTLAI